MDDEMDRETTADRRQAGPGGRDRADSGTPGGGTAADRRQAGPGGRDRADSDAPDGETAAPHRLVNPPTMAPAAGFAHAVVPAEGRTVHLAGQTASDAAGAIVGDTFCEQYDMALANVVEALRHAGGRPTDLVSLVVYTTDMQAYRDDRAAVGAAHRRHLGRHYPAMALLGVTSLFDPDALVEIIAAAVIPAPRADR